MRSLFILFLVVVIIAESAIIGKQNTYKQKLLKQLETNEETIYMYYDSLQIVKDDYFLLCKQFDSIDKLNEKLTK